LDYALFSFKIRGSMAGVTDLGFCLMNGVWIWVCVSEQVMLSNGFTTDLLL
jgi:hypothetical protein